MSRKHLKSDKTLKTENFGNKRIKAEHVHEVIGVQTAYRIFYYLSFNVQSPAFKKILSKKSLIELMTST